MHLDYKASERTRIDEGHERGDGTRRSAAGKKYRISEYETSGNEIMN
jgi:hypothetical protein